MKMKKVISLALAATLVLGLCACGKKEEQPATKDNQPAAQQEDNQQEEVDESTLSHAELSSKVYNEVLGEFLAAYNPTKTMQDVDEKYAYEAIAEAKLMEAAVMLPTTGRGGQYAMTRYGYHTSDFVLWGNDSNRFTDKICTEEPILKEDIEALKGMYAELKGTGTYNDEAAKYLEGKGYTLKDTFNITFSSDPNTWDCLATSRSADSEAIDNTYDRLLEYDCEGNLNPCLAESYDVAADGLTYTFHLRKGVKWVDSQGRQVGEVTADDFVAGMNHLLDTLAGLESLISGVIVNVDKYISGEVTDFSEVGVEAADDYTLVYHLAQPCSYFLTMLGYNIFAPMNRAYYVSQGGKFGAEYDASASDYKYGTDQDHIAYCGPYLVTNNTKGNTIVFEANPEYWDADGIRIHKITWLFNDGTDATKTYQDFKKGIVDSCTVTNAVLEIAKEDGLFDKYAYVSDVLATSFMGFINMNRKAFANANDESKVVSQKTEEQVAKAKKALRNVHFRRALCMGFDRGSYNEQKVGVTLRTNNLRNSYTPGNFVYLSKDVTVQINGQNVTFPAGTAYGAIMQAQIDADGVALKVWDPNAEEGLGSGDGFDGWYNPTESAKELAQAATELGFDISADDPVYIDYPCFMASEIYANAGNALKQSVEAATNGGIILNLVQCDSIDEWYYAGYYTNTGDESNYDICDVSGWGPDYGDPCTYLDTMLPDFAGYMVRNMGMF